MKSKYIFMAICSLLSIGIVMYKMCAAMFHCGTLPPYLWDHFLFSLLRDIKLTKQTLYLKPMMKKSAMFIMKFWWYLNRNVISLISIIATLNRLSSLQS